MKSFVRFSLIVPFVLPVVLAFPAVAAEPSAEIGQLIELFEGRWLVREKHEPSEWSARGAIGVGTAEFVPGPGSASLIQKYRSTVGDFPFEGHGVTWWNSKARHFEGIWCENTDPDGCGDSGAVVWKDDRLVTEYESETNGKRTKERRTISEITPHSFTVVIELAVGDAPLRPAITVEYQRQGTSRNAGD